MARSAESSGPMFIGLGLGVAAVAAALSCVSIAIGPPSIPIWVCAIGGATYVFRGPLGTALASRIAAPAEARPDVGAEVYGELDEMRQHIAELEERLDFTERLLAAPREQRAEHLTPT